MQKRPEQPPEGRLLAAALKDSGLSIREASRRAGISYGRWRQVVNGVQHVSPGNFAAVHAPAGTLARMAQAVGISADRMETEGARPDAAAEMRRAPAPGPQDDSRQPGPGHTEETPPDRQRLAAYVTSARLAAGWKDVRSFATATGLTERTLSKLEHAQRVSPGTLATVAAHVGWAPDTPRIILAGGEPPAQAPAGRNGTRDPGPSPLALLDLDELSDDGRRALRDPRITAKIIPVVIDQGLEHARGTIPADPAEAEIAAIPLMSPSDRIVLRAAVRVWREHEAAGNERSVR
jgi:hypothetical protein